MTQIFNCYLFHADDVTPLVSLTLDKSTNIATMATNVANTEESHSDQQQTAEAVQNLIQLGGTNLAATTLVTGVLQKTDSGYTLF